MGYLKCKSCKGYYELQREESPTDFEKCECGGDLEFYDDPHQRRESNTYSGERKRKTHPLLKF